MTMILAIDTATETLGLALHDGHAILGESVRPARLRHTVELAPAVADLLAQCGVSADEVGGLGVAQGPGSYTALRIGIAFAAGFALPRNLAVAGVPTLDILAAAQPRSDAGLVAVVHAGRGRVAAARYAWRDGAWRMTGEPAVWSLEKLLAGMLSGDILCGEIDRHGWTALEKRKDVTAAPAPSNVRRPGVLAELAAARLRNPSAPRGMPQPVYLPSAPAETNAEEAHA